MCTGQTPFKGNSTQGVLKQICQATPRPICELNPALPDWLIDIVSRLHAKNPDERIQSAAKLGETLWQRLRKLS
jgi:serine/threonine protein kinase